MDHNEAGKYWNDNAEAWTVLARSGYDVYRDYLNTPSFLAMLPDVTGLNGLDIGCGEGANTRCVAGRGAVMEAIDISDVFIRYACESESESPLGINYQVASMVALPFADEQFDFATAFMSLMDVPELEVALAEAFRVIKPSGFFQLSITHPCFDTPHRKNLRNEGVTYAIEVGEYFRQSQGGISEWTFSSAPQELKATYGKFRVPVFHRTLSEWFNLILQTGFTIERLQEPEPSDEAIHLCPAIQDATTVAYFLQVRLRKHA